MSKVSWPTYLAKTATTTTTSLKQFNPNIWMFTKLLQPETIWRATERAAHNKEFAKKMKTQRNLHRHTLTNPKPPASHVITCNTKVKTICYCFFSLSLITLQVIELFERTWVNCFCCFGKMYSMRKDKAREREANKLNYFSITRPLCTKIALFKAVSGLL